KAKQDPINTTDWLKFLGKVFQHEKVQGRTTFGCLITLNGCNGAVAGAYNTLQTRHDRIKLVDSSDVRKLIFENSFLCPQEFAEQSLRSITDRVAIELKPAYHAGKFYWICGFEGNIALILDENGVALSARARSSMMDLLSVVSSYTDHININEEAVAQA